MSRKADPELARKIKCGILEKSAKRCQNSPIQPKKPVSQWGRTGVTGGSVRNSTHCFAQCSTSRARPAGLLAHTLCSCGGGRGSAPRWVAQGDFYLKLYVLYAKLGVISSCNAYALVISSPGQGDNPGSIPGNSFFDFCPIQAPKPLSFR